VSSRLLLARRAAVLWSAAGGRAPGDDCLIAAAAAPDSCMRPSCLAASAGEEAFRLLRRAAESGVRAASISLSLNEMN
jgi:hypothetical protein